MVGPRDPELTALERNARELFRDVVARSPQLSDDLQTVALNIDDPVRLADFIAANLSLSTLLRQELLETADVRKRLETLVRELSKEIEVLELRNKIQEQVQEQVSQSQREYLLREQMKAIQKELGESDDSQTEIEELRKKIEESGMPAEARKECDRELKRLQKMTPASAEYMVSRTYLEWMTALPWAKSSGAEEIDIAKAQQILDEDHYDLEKVKERILDYLAVKKLQPGMKGPILCFLGPPGVGKTSLGKSIATALGRKFVRISLGGMHDEAEIRGHRRTYIGALPGQIIQGIRRGETNDPVFMLDEVDKLGRDFRGDPSSALMEVLDPEQNSSFRDHYLDVPFDLSKVLFIATANWIDPIPEPLRDRMEIIELAGYTEVEKVHIANKYLIPKQADRTRPEDRRTDRVHRRRRARDHSQLHARSRRAQPGTRDRHHCRKQARRMAEGKTEQAGGDAGSRARISGHAQVPLRTRSRRAHQASPAFPWGWSGRPSAATSSSSKRPACAAARQFTMTGHLGEVMQESMTAALTWVRANAERYGIDPGLLPQAGHPHPRALGRGPQGRPLGGRGHGDRAGQPAQRAAGAADAGHDRRDFAHRLCAAGGRHQGKGAGREARRHPRGDSARGKRDQRQRGPGRASAGGHADPLRPHAG